VNKGIRNNLSHYLNPIRRLGNKRYSVFFPLLITLLAVIILEIYAYGIAHDPNAIGLAAIFIFIGLILYFSFRDGIIGGLITTTITIAYYFYIIYTRHHSGQQLVTSVETTLILGLLYLGVTGIVGWLKQTIDGLIEREADEKKRLQTIVEQLPVGIIITNKDGKIVQANKKLESIIGVKIPVGFKIGTDTPLVTSRYNNKPTMNSHSPLLQALTTGKPVLGREFIIERKDGKKVQIQISASPVHNKAGKIIAAAEIITDITQQKEEEARKDDFINIASHELKTPITSMKLYVNSLLFRIKEMNDNKTSAIVQNILHQTDRLHELVNDLLDVTRLHTGKLNFTREAFFINDVLQKAVNDLQMTTRHHKIIYQKNHLLKVHADKFRIEQVVINIITNAIKYSPPNTTITVTLKKKDNKAIVSIKDEGLGIIKEQQRKIFDRLYQVTEPKEKTFPGLGIGLYISKQIIKRHKGVIWVESEKGKGSTFFFSLPLLQKN
jgi:signal transduction histidine kinase